MSLGEVLPKGLMGLHWGCPQRRGVDVRGFPAAPNPAQPPSFLTGVPTYLRLLPGPPSAPLLRHVFLPFGGQGLAGFGAGFTHRLSQQRGGRAGGRKVSQARLWLTVPASSPHAGAGEVPWAAGQCPEPMARPPRRTRQCPAAPGVPSEVWGAAAWPAHPAEPSLLSQKEESGSRFNLKSQMCCWHW